MSEDGPGRPRSISDDDVVRALTEITGPAATASEVARHLDTSHQTASRRLEELEELGKVRSKEVGANAVIWWISGE